MKISILDQSPISSGKTPKDALDASIKLAQFADEAGYTRYWIAEHHDMAGLANPAPDVMLGIIGSKTKRIRIGAGAVLLPHYKPYNVAERYNLLATLYPRRIDLGIGRAPGGSAEASMALSGNFLENVRNMPESLDELQRFLTDSFPEENMYANISPAPVPDIPPQVWLLGTSEKSGQLAVEKNLPYTFGHFMSDANGPKIIQNYLKGMKDKAALSLGKPIVAVSVVCAETTEEAEELALSSQLWSILSGKGEGNAGIPSIQEAKQYSYTSEEKEKMLKQKEKMIIGNPKEVKHQLEHLQSQYQTDEFMIITITHDYKARQKSYELLGNEILKS